MYPDFSRGSQLGGVRHRYSAILRMEGLGTAIRRFSGWRGQAPRFGDSPDRRGRHRDSAILRMEGSGTAIRRFSGPPTFGWSVPVCQLLC